MESVSRKMLVTSALPYASGPIHMGHLVEYIQTDIWVRYQRLIGNDCTYLCASDAHGTPIMLKARKDGISPEELVATLHTEHKRDLASFLVEFDNFHTTHSEENRELVEQIFARLDAKGLITKRTIEQAYDEQAGMFLPDRFVRGTCPMCSAEDQAGDNCEACSRTYSPSDLLDPKSVISGTTPIRKESEHYFFRLGKFEASLRQWMADGHVSQSVARKLDEWFEVGLQDWDISRDAPYFGCKIPGTEDKYFYVWLDAPIGYMSSLVNLGRKNGGTPDLDTYFGADSEAELYHFIGKDIIYFHTLFWPAVLEGAGYRKPTGVFAHGFLTVNGQKMSKSRGTFISAATYLEELNPEYLRYYYAFRLGPGIDDLDLSLDDFVARINSDLVGKFVNIASRCAGFIRRNFAGRLAGELDDPVLFDTFLAAGDSISQAYEEREFSRAMREIMKLADRANQYIDEHKPWQLVKDETQLPRVQAVCTQGLNLFRVLMTYLKPTLPSIATAAESFLNNGPLTWDNRCEPLLDAEINTFVPLISRLDNKAVARLVEKSAELAREATPTPATNSDKAMISIDDFLNVDLRIAEIISAQAVDGADKLIRITVSLGDERRTVLAGIRTAYDPETLVGRQVIIVANLEPRKMRFGTSEGMLLAAGPGGEDIFLVSPDAGAQPGMRVR
ncbi:MAG TPA: methionine--tRNA ligase [Gammaproteobacteria bacterium]|jgi:methionyl-tRNA synthetase|nr:methionine--tRNA ligase [Gammaproteobacteria bacterium]MDP7659927.1 methionine--tRNA ligase [Gammaproteobacteria bacterium]HJP38863.1 methionine--tRNA ligase [Gammaproteobacteria bacterium]